MFDDVFVKRKMVLFVPLRVFSLTRSIAIALAVPS